MKATGTVIVAYGLGCVAVDALGWAGVIGGPLWLKVTGIPLALFTIWFGAMAFRWA